MGKRQIKRREFIRITAGGTTVVVAGAPPFLLAGCGSSSDDGPDAGPDGAMDAAADAMADAAMDGGIRAVPPLASSPDASGLLLPEGFTSRIVATTTEVVSGSSYTWHSWPDGGATYDTGDGGWIYVSNSELPAQNGGVGAIKFGSDGTIIDAYSILTGTSRNCAGGATPWGTWLSCEEVPTGLVWECDPTGANAGVVRPAMGAFNHEAAAVDEVNRTIYLTEDRGDGALYRFVPTTWEDLSAGVLEVMVDTGGGVPGWETVPDPSGAMTDTRKQVTGTMEFAGGEGAWFSDGVLYFTTKIDNRVWSYTVASNTLDVVYDIATHPTPLLSGVDNIVGASTGSLYVAEDGGDMQVVIIQKNGAVAPIAQVTGTVSSEITGPAFSPDGTRLYFSSQREPGTTYEVTGPFNLY